ncbi:MAG: hypothetical protein H7Z43_00220 [Clostridia bacterium]|nr:hypothetical protein [Deltaproteobacteria bacterium]
MIPSWALGGRLVTDWEMVRGADKRDVTVPCTVAGVLRDSGQWRVGDPGDFDRELIVFRTTVIVTAGEELVFEGLTPSCEVVIDDVLCALADSMFVPIQLPIASGRHVLELRFQPIDLAAKKTPKARWRSRIFDDPQRRWSRVTGIGHTPFLSPSFATVGPWRPVRLVNPELQELDIRVRLDGRRGSVQLRGETRSGVSVSIVGDGGNANANWGPGEFDLTLSLSDVATWWPHTHGPQPTYTLTVRAGETKVSKTIAFRNVELDAGMQVRVNGQPVFSRGVNWTPVDPLTMGADVAAEVARMRAAGMNMVRLTATSLYESDAFYEACTAAGILVWQDFQFSNLDYPFADDAFLRSAKAEAHCFLRRTQTEACLAVLCANAEVRMQAYLTGVTPPAEPFYDETLPALCASVRPDVPFVPGSPSGGDTGIEPREGCSHYYGVGAYMRPLSDARLSHVRFASECLGFAMLPALESRAAWHDVPWQSRYQRFESGAGDLADENEFYIRELFGVDPLSLRGNDRPLYDALLDITPGSVMAETFALWRTSEHNKGGLVWLWRDVWPSIGLGVIDAAGRPKAAYHYLKRAFAPRAVFLRDEGLNNLDVWLLNDKLQSVSLPLILELYKDDRLLERFEHAVHVSGNSRQRIAATKVIGRFADLSFAFRFGPKPYDLIVARWGDAPVHHFFPGGKLPIPHPASVGFEGVRDGDDITLSTIAFANTVIIEGANASHDNYFHLAPSESRKLRVGPAPVRIRALSSRDILRL